MIKIPHIEISIKYKKPNGHEETTQVSPDEFFDLEDGDSLGRSIFDLVWHKSHANEFVGIPPDALSMTRLEIHCPATKERIVDVEQFWAGGTCRTLLRREELDGCEVYWLRIVEIKTPEGIHFARFGSESKEESGLLEHHLVLNNEDVRFLFPG